jgi:alpha-1,2-mannosyltransferase
LRKHWLWVAIGAAGLVIHAGTAALRLTTFFPVPRLLDFSAFYASAWAIRLGMSPYNLSADWLGALQRSQSIPFAPPPIYNPPFWPWLLVPLTWFSFPVAAWIWLILNLGLLLLSAITLTDLAGYRSWRARCLIFVLVVTFGPTFLDLTLGQTSVVLMAAALAIGRCMSSRRRWAGLFAAGAAALAVGCKLFPLSWLPAWPVLRRWRYALLSAILVLAVAGLSLLVSPAGSRAYWAYLFEERLATASAVPSVDDQALIAWLDRLVLPQVFDVSGVGVEQRQTVFWTPLWSVDATTVRWLGYGLIGLLLIMVLLVLLRTGQQHAEAGMYLWILFGLVALLHIERYNHVLLLPAMAWLWGRGGWTRKVVVMSYTLVGLARLTHLWAVLLPAPWGPLASGFGLYAVFALGVAMAVSMWSAGKEVRGSTRYRLSGTAQ